VSSRIDYSFQADTSDSWSFRHSTVVDFVEVVAAHPVHAELRAASPKTATRDPISLDAVLVCCKHTRTKARALDLDTVIENASLLAKRLSVAGIKIRACHYS